MWSGKHNNDTEKEEESILLLQPIITNQNPPTKSSPTTCSIGGVAPTYYPNDIPFPHPKCKLCDEPLSLLIQIYAPLQTLNRTLFVFGCNRSCGKGWRDDDDVDELGGKAFRCFRSQEVVVQETKKKKKEGGNETDKTEKESGNKTSDSFSWGCDDDDDDEKDGDWGGEDGDWGGDDGGWNDVEMEDDTNKIREIEAMLTTCELQSTTANLKPKKKKKKNEKKANHIEKETIDILPDSSIRLPYYELELFNEPTKSRKEDTDSSDDDSSDEMDAEKNIETILSKYLEEENDEDILSALQRKPSSNPKHGCFSGKTKMGEKYERLPPAQRAFLAFRNRLKRAPRQVARYVYGGEALWSRPCPKLTTKHQPTKTKKSNNPSPKPSQSFPSVPDCPGCGSKRNFEFQIMPTLLHVLNVDQCAPSSSSSSSSQSTKKDMKFQNEGMNWGVIAIYSCDKSCNDCREEFVVVQDSVDEENPVKRKVIEKLCDDDDDKDDCRFRCDG